MASGGPARGATPRIRGRRTRVAGLLAVVAALAAALASQLPASSSSTPAAPADVVRSDHRGARGDAGGVIPDGTTVFDDAIPGVADLDPALLGALRRAATDAAAVGVRFVVNSGRRSPEHQQRLFDQAIVEHGSAEEAARWVATPATSAHVSGDAVDVGPSEAAAWLSGHGARYGLCQVYANEPWHYELRPHAVDLGCPPMYADPTQDPRTQG